MTTVEIGSLPALAREIAAAGYDRSPGLSEAERLVTALWLTPGTHVVTRGKLPRLYDPLARIFLCGDADRASRTGSVKHLLIDVGRTGHAYWGWNGDHWLDLMHREPTRSGHVLAAAYLLCGFRRLSEIRSKPCLAGVARIVFGRGEFDAQCERLLAALEGAGFQSRTMRMVLPSVIAVAALAVGDAQLESFDANLLSRLGTLYPASRHRHAILSSGLVALGLLAEPAARRQRPSQRGVRPGEVLPEWTRWCERWEATSTTRPQTRRDAMSTLLRVGIWLAREHPGVTAPGDWTAELCAAYVAAVDRLRVGDWAGSDIDVRVMPLHGKLLAAPTKMNMYRIVRRFFFDVEAWGWAKLRCNPAYHLASPLAVRRLVTVNPRVIDDAVWLKLVWASLNLSGEDVAGAYGYARYPLEMVKAVAVVWTHTGLRRDEIVRLRLGCTSPIKADVLNEHGAPVPPAAKLCWLRVPVNKTAGEFVKPVATAVHEHVVAWHEKRPVQRSTVDDKTGEVVDLLFQLRNRRLGPEFVNNVIIPMLCRKAGVAEKDTIGRITSHRGRASAVTALANAPEGMTIFELAEWCGHRSPNSTLHYVKVRPTRLARSFAKADAASRMVSVVLDAEAIARGKGEPWKYYDLGHSWCSNAFWSSCPHRMACAGCYFNVPKQSAKGLILAAQQSIGRLLEEVWLSPNEREAVEGDVAALDGMLAKLRDVPTLDGRTPREIDGRAASADQ